MPLQKAFLSNSAVLAELSNLLSSTPDRIYQKRSLNHSQKKVSSIGAHCRHIIEFYQSFLNGTVSGNINYDHRARNVELEINRLLALREVQNIQQQLTDLVNNQPPEKSFHLQAQVDPENAVLTKTNLVRELVFLQAHSVHHQAMIALLMHCFEQAVPNEFGVATSTRIHNQELETQATD